jgi:hypothetical protein
MGVFRLQALQGDEIAKSGRNSFPLESVKSPEYPLDFEETVLGRKILFDANRRFARCACSSSSRVKRRTTTLVSTATTTSLQLFGDGSLHFIERFCRALILEAAGNVFQVCWRQGLSRTQQNAIRRVFHQELSSSPPCVGIANGFRQNDLAF